MIPAPKLVIQNPSNPSDFFFFFCKGHTLLHGHIRVTVTDLIFLPFPAVNTEKIAVKNWYNLRQKICQKKSGMSFLHKMSL